MATERGAEQPLNKFARFKNNPRLWEQEMSDYGLTEDEKNLLRPILETSFGVCESQEKFMSLVQLPAAGGHSLLWADRLRKAVGKKDPVEYDKLTAEFFETAEKKNLSMPFCRYIWNVLVATSRGYGFNASHTLAYSLIGLQEMNLAYRFPRIFWDTACLIVDSGGGEEGDVWSEDEDEEEIVYTSGPEVFDTEEEDDDDEEETPVAKKAKAKPRSIDFGKIATAIGKIQSFGIKVLPPDINLSSYTFTPNVKNNTIHYGLSGIAQVGEDLVQSIMANRPYTSFEDFVGRVKQTKPQTIKLIKAGAFDEFGDRESIMSDYLESIADTKKVINLRNMRLILEKNLLPDSLELEVKIFNFNKYLKGFKSGNYYLMNEISLGFFEKNFDYNLLVPADEDEEALLKIPASAWDKIYRKRMDPIRNYLKANQSEVLSRINDDALEVVRKKYASGNVRTWEMDSISFYSDKHELDGVNLAPYGVEDFFQMPETPEIEEIIHIKGKPIKLYHITRIAGSVLDRNKQKGLVTLLTTTGVVQVRIFGALFAHYDKQISEIIPESGRKRIVERSVFTRGNKIIVSGIRQGDMFIAKKYARTPFSLIEKITDIGEDGSLTLVRRNREGE